MGYLINSTALSWAGYRHEKKVCLAFAALLEASHSAICVTCFSPLVRPAFCKSCFSYSTFNSKVFACIFRDWGWI